MVCNSSLGFDFIELKQDNGQEDFDWYNGQVSAQRCFWGPWENRLNFITAWLTYVVNADGTILVTNNSTEYPDIRGLVPLTASVRGWGAVSNTGSLGMISFQKAKITIKYGIPPFGSNNGNNTQNNGNNDPYIPFTSMEGSVSTEVQVIPGPFKKDGSLIPGLNEIYLTLTKEDCSITQSMIPNPNWDSFANAAGTINSTTLYLPGNFTVAPARALYLGHNYRQKFLPDGSEVWEIIHRLSLRQNPRWDQKVVKDTVTGFPTFDLLPTNPGIFNTSDLNQLFIQGGNIPEES